jgi:hypothetical protein
METENIIGIHCGRLSELIVAKMRTEVIVGSK